MKINKITFRALTLFCSFLLITGCSSQILDKSLKTKAFTVNENNVAKKMEVPQSELTGVYKGIDDMYTDSNYVVSGVVKDIEYFEDKDVLLRKINVIVTKSYKGNITRNTIISILENDGYLRLKSLYEDLKKAYEEQGGDKAKEDSWLYTATYMTDIKDIGSDMLIKYYYFYKEDSKIDDELLLFLTDSSDDTYKDKKVKFTYGVKLTYPKGSYAPLGIGMGKFTRVGNSYNRYNLYYTPEGTITREIQNIKKSYTVKEMDNALNKLK